MDADHGADRDLGGEHLGHQEHEAQAVVLREADDRAGRRAGSDAAAHGAAPSSALRQVTTPAKGADDGAKRARVDQPVEGGLGRGLVIARLGKRRRRRRSLAVASSISWSASNPGWPWATVDKRTNWQWASAYSASRRSTRLPATRRSAWARRMSSSRLGISRLGGGLASAHMVADIHRVALDEARHLRDEVDLLVGTGTPREADLVAHVHGQCRGDRHHRRGGFRRGEALATSISSRAQPATARPDPARRCNKRCASWGALGAFACG